MGPPIYIGGNDLIDPLTWMASYGFNGATDLHRWKHEIPEINQVVDFYASMGPPIYIGGNVGP